MERGIGHPKRREGEKMPTGEDMRSLAQEIEGSYDSRVKDIAVIRRQVGDTRQAARTQLSELHKTQQAMASGLHADLAKGHVALVSGTATLLKEMDAAHRDMAREQKAALQRGRATLGNDVSRQLKDLGAAHKKMGLQQRASLAIGRSELASNVMGQLKEIDTTRKTMANKQKQALAKSRAELAASMAAMITGMRAERVEAVDEWGKLETRLTAKKSGGAVEEQPVEPSSPTKTAMSVPEPEMPSQIGAMRAQVFEYLAGHPDGTRMTELEMEFSMHRVQMARVLRNLIDENKVEKRDLLYFAI